MTAQCGFQIGGGQRGEQTYGVDLLAKVKGWEALK